MIVRALQASDADACARIHRQCFAHPWPTTEIEAMTVSAQSTAHAAVADDSGEVLGFVISRSVLDEAEVLTLAVSPEHRRQGVAAVMLDAHLSTLALKRVCRLFLEVEEGNLAARALYAKFGFVENGRREGYYRRGDGGRATALILRKDVI